MLEERLIRSIPDPKRPTPVSSNNRNTRKTVVSDSGIAAGPVASVERQPDARLAKKPKTSSASSASRVSSGTTAAGVGGRSAAGGLRQERGDEVYWPSIGDQVEVKKDLGDDPRWGDLGSWQWCHGRSVSTSVFSRPCERALVCGSALVCLMRCVRKRHMRTCTRGCMILLEYVTVSGQCLSYSARSTGAFK